MWKSLTYNQLLCVMKIATNHIYFIQCIQFQLIHQYATNVIWIYNYKISRIPVCVLMFKKFLVCPIWMYCNWWEGYNMY
jgi:hypothetical protein